MSFDDLSKGVGITMVVFQDLIFVPVSLSLDLRLNISQNCSCSFCLLSRDKRLLLHFEGTPVPSKQGTFVA